MKRKSSEDSPRRLAERFGPGYVRIVFPPPPDVMYQQYKASVKREERGRKALGEQE